MMPADAAEFSHLLLACTWWAWRCCWPCGGCCAAPSAPDRILALDTLNINAIALLVLFGIWLDTALYFEAALLIAMMGFVGTVALSDT